MNIIATFKLTPAGRRAIKKGSDLLSSSGFKTMHLINIRNWRTRKVSVGGDKVEVHDEEWLFAADGDLISLSCSDLGDFTEAVLNGFYKVE